MKLRTPARAISLAAVAVTAGTVLIVGAPTAMASHESSNHLTYAPVAGDTVPDASGQGVINYVKGTSGQEPNTEWTSSFRFSGLSGATTYTVIVKGRFAVATESSAICSFTTTTSGDGGCAARFTGLQRLAVSQLVTGDGPAGVPVLQATRQAVLAGPGSITSSGGCREPDQGGSTCVAPGRGCQSPVMAARGSVFGTEAGLRAAYSAYGGELLGAATRALGDRHAAEDAVQETFLRVWRSADAYDELRGTERGWLHTVLRNVVVDIVRARHARPVQPVAELGEVQPLWTRPEQAVDEALLRWEVEGALGQLTDEHRHVILAMHYGGHPAVEVAAELQIPVATVRTRLFYALRSLRLGLDESGWNHG